MHHVLRAYRLKYYQIIIKTLSNIQVHNVHFSNVSIISLQGRLIIFGGIISLWHFFNNKMFSYLKKQDLLYYEHKFYERNILTLSYLVWGLNYLWLNQKKKLIVYPESLSSSKIFHKVQPHLGVSKGFFFYNNLLYISGEIGRLTFWGMLQFELGNECISKVILLKTHRRCTECTLIAS